MQLLVADSTEEALEVLANRGDQCQVLAGGTDVMIQYARGEISRRCCTSRGSPSCGRSRSTAPPASARS